MANTQEPRLFDFHLDARQEERARRLHRESIVIDMLFQGPMGAAGYTPEMVAQVEADYERHHDPWKAINFARMLPERMAARGGFPAVQQWWDESGITAGNRQLGMNSLQEAIVSMGVATLQFDRFPWFIKALSAGDIRRAKAEGKHAGFVTTQNTIAIGQELDNLDMFHELGLRVIQLTYNSMNFVGAGCTERTDAGVSTFGAKLIERMNKLGIVVDTGHCGHRTTVDACELSKAPVIASHTAAQGVTAHARGKKDEALVALARTGGVIGVVAVTTFVSSAPNPTIEHMLDHIDYVSKLVGWEHVGIGTDWPMSMPDFCGKLLQEKVAPTIGFRPQDPVPGTETLEGFRDYRQFINITRGLVSRGYTDEQVRGILGGNWLRVIEQVWK